MKPCKNCPWRLSTKTKDIPGGGMDHRKARRMMQPESLQAMGCHLEPDREARPCAGFVLQVGVDNVGIRLALAQRRFKLSDFSCEDPLHPTMDALLSVHADPNAEGKNGLEL